MRAQKTDSSIRQAQILNHALELIGEHCVSGLSMAQLARRVGPVNSGLYRHYESKDALVQ
jgi:AcrR family transcriptional regulator